MSAKRLHSTIMVLGLFLWVGAAQATDWSTNLPCFYGGSYDGWDRQTMTNVAGLGSADVTMSSGIDQPFSWTAANPALAMLTITATTTGGTITNGGTMRVSVPAALGCRFDTGAAVSIGGGASGKVGTANYSGDGRTLIIPVTADFVNGDTLTVAGLKLLDLRLAPAGTQRLGLDFTGDGMLDVYDQYALLVSVTCPGGSYDGWDRYAMVVYKNIYVPQGTVFSIR